jgi:hypothetical protein
MVPAADVLLIAGSEPRGGPIAARIRRFATRYTSLEALPLACTRTLCGEGWDVALLELDPVCDHGTTPCLTPLGVATSPPTIGMPLSAVGFGQRPARDLRQEWALGLGADGGGVRRVGTARVTQIVSSQLLRANADGEAATLLCVGDHGAALVSRRDGAWQLDGVGLMRTAAAADAEGGSAAGVSGCPEEQARAWGVHVSRCWLEATVGGWGMSPLVDAHASECGHSRESNPRALSSTRGGQKKESLSSGPAVGPVLSLSPQLALIGCLLWGVLQVRPARLFPSRAAAGLNRRGRAAGRVAGGARCSTVARTAFAWATAAPARAATSARCAPLTRPRPRRSA